MLRVVGALAAFWLAGCEEPPPAAQDIVRSVKTLEISERAAARERQLAGALAAVQSSELSFALPGTVEEVLVEEGADVAAGQVLALLDAGDYELALTTAQARLSAARAAFEEQRLTYERQRTLFEKDIVARAALDRAEAALRTARADVRAAESDAARAQRDTERTVLAAPFAGRVAARRVEPFQEIAAGAPAFVIEGAEGLQAEVLVPETMIREVSHGDAVRLSFPTLGEVEGPGTVTEIGARLDAGNAFPVSIRLEPAATEGFGGLRAGMTVRATFALTDGDAPAGYLVPISAIALDGARAADAAANGASEGAAAPNAPDPAGGGRREAPLFVFDEATGAVRRVTVAVGDLRGNQVEVFEGLSPGDRVVVAGVAFLHDGMAARLWSPDL
ncbi:MAG: efflux RND transporter periplasmic adaptor subunit [Alphaproteobacteria bacterium]|nr:efflux RND transporter periplasmic adaptor subunit [Alphaproteobacteria bacterium]